MEVKSKNKIIVILGPTASGKSDVAIELAKKFNGEIISADSRQVYRKMDIGTGKVESDLSNEIPKKIPKRKTNTRSRVFTSQSILHYCIDIVSPKTEYNVSKFKKDADKIIKKILAKNKLPIICGGTGFWIKSVVDDISFPEVKPNLKLRKKLEKEKTEKLFEKLKKLDPQRAKNIDSKNKVRLIRAIEIATKLGKVPPTNNQKTIINNQYIFLQIGINISKEKLHGRIEKRLDQRFRQGMIKEVSDLHFKENVSWKRLEYFGLEYRWIAQYLQGKISKKEMAEGLLQDIKKYAKRQMTWFGKDKRIKWIKKYLDIEKEVKKFI